MLVRDKNTMESYRHYCDNKNIKVIAKYPPIYLHDVHASMLVNDILVYVKYCPYCGIEIDTETRPNN